ncbi:hypothetical protein VB796_14545 [Arcicella sp. LKC2W]|uniref:hypothetical protein n=1 Tax=Arcicella sp. LKC2W TaxID=2984198 RepID=UPI002B2105E1|nr:hypothetical protein [Arcicella sp. LKC2W]MEA5460273.1 hypothetical protein [Arcicella sp. LKC2W]
MFHDSPESLFVNARFWRMVVQMHDFGKSWYKCTILENRSTNARFWRMVVQMHDFGKSWYMPV